jgi:hypothetical protein
MRLSSVYSDAHFNIDQELVLAPTLAKPPKPEFDVAVRIKKAPKPTPVEQVGSLIAYST